MVCLQRFWSHINVKFIYAAPDYHHYIAQFLQIHVDYSFEFDFFLCVQFMQSIKVNHAMFHKTLVWNFWGFFEEKWYGCFLVEKYHFQQIGKVPTFSLSVWGLVSLYLNSFYLVIWRKIWYNSWQYYITDCVIFNIEVKKADFKGNKGFQMLIKFFTQWLIYV